MNSYNRALHFLLARPLEYTFFLRFPWTRGTKWKNAKMLFTFILFFRLVQQYCFWPVIALPSQQGKILSSMVDNPLLQSKRKKNNKKCMQHTVKRTKCITFFTLHKTKLNFQIYNSPKSKAYLQFSTIILPFISS